MSYAAAKALFRRDPATSWAAYVAGALLVLARERGLSLASCGGLSILVSSDVPEGKGVSSSAAVEVAAMSALAAALGVELEGRALALLCQKVENHVVGELHYCCILCSAALHGYPGGQPTAARLATAVHLQIVPPALSTLPPVSSLAL